jgi:penicillin-binding protein 1A
MGITSQLGTDASIALGTSEVTLLDLTSAFTPFANGGYSVQPYVVKRITTRDGKILYERKGDGFGQAVSARALGAMNNMMRAVVEKGTAKSARIRGFDVAGKTGTSQDYRDAWFIGYTTHYVGGVWVGNDDNSPTKNVTGGSIPAAIWRDVMVEALAGLSPEPLPGDIRDEFEEPAPYMVSADEGTGENLYSDAPPPQRKQRSFLEKLFGGNDAEREKPKRRIPLTNPEK